MSSSQPQVYLKDIDVSPESSQAPTPKRKASELATGTESKENRYQSKLTSNGLFFSKGAKESGDPVEKKLRTASGAVVLANSSATASKDIGKPKLNSIPFSLSAFQEALSEEERELLRLECETMGLSWLKLLKDEIKKSYFLNLKKFLQSGGLRSSRDTPPGVDIYPPAKDIYSWTKTPLGKVKVVIIGQDPYHGAGQAHGLCFSVPIGVKTPPSLLNIYQELKNEYPDFKAPSHGNLIAWANNGVLMLNTCLTVKAKEAGSHSRKGWEQFTEKVIDTVDQYGGANLPSCDGSGPAGIGRGIVFLAWGAWAAERVSKLNKSRHLILTSAHPSPYAAHRGFFGNGHFRKANAWLEKKYGPDGKVDWCSLQVTEPPE